MVWWSSKSIGFKAKGKKSQFEIVNSDLKITGISISTDWMDIQDTCNNSSRLNKGNHDHDSVITILFFRFTLSFSVDFPNTSNSSKILCCAAYFQSSSRCLKVKSVVKLWYITSPPTNNVKQDRWRLLYLLTCTLYLFYEETASQGQFLLYRNWKMKSRNHYSHQICFYQHLISIKHKRFWYPHKIVGEVIVFKVFFLWLSKVKIT